MNELTDRQKHLASRAIECARYDDLQLQEAIKLAEQLLEQGFQITDVEISGIWVQIGWTGHSLDDVKNAVPAKTDTIYTDVQRGAAKPDKEVFIEVVIR